MISVDDKIIKYFPELKNSKKGEITVQDLLEMRSGLNCEEFYDVGPNCEGDMFDSEDWIAFCLGVKLMRQTGLIVQTIQ